TRSARRSVRSAASKPGPAGRRRRARPRAILRRARAGSRNARRAHRNTRPASDTAPAGPDLRSRGGCVRAVDVSSSAIIAAALLWMVVAIRLPTLTRSPAQRYLFVGLVALALGFTLDIPQVVAGLHDRGAGPNVPHLAKHIMVIVAASAVQEVVRALGLDPAQAAEHRTRRALTGGGATAALIALFALAP